jgi:hypothetical protein
MEMYYVREYIFMHNVDCFVLIYSYSVCSIT